ncbi:MAG TPA: PLP-dependent aminotransferase family protein [Candidatus Obscuribacterales bacterium]
MDFPIILNPGMGPPLWKQLSCSLREAIEHGRLSPGDALPPTRHLAHLLGVSRDTVVRSYEELKAQGYVEAITGSGTFVRRRPVARVSGDSNENGRSTAWRQAESFRLSQQAAALANLKLGEATSADQPALNFGAAPADLLPVRLWREILARHSNLRDPLRLDYSADVFGYRPLREAIASYLRRSKGLDCQADEIVVFTDSQHAHDLIARLVINPGDLVVMEDPGYGAARKLFQCYGATVCPIPVDEEGLVTSELESVRGHCKLIYVTPSHQDPTGAAMSMVRRKALLEWANRHGAVIIEDAFDSDYRYASQPMPALMKLDATGSVLYVYSFWKTLFPISTVGCIVLPPALASLFERSKLLTQRNFPIVEHYALTDFIAEGHLERHIRKTRAIYARRRQALIFALSRRLKSAVQFAKESAGLHALVRFDLKRDDETILRCASEAALPLASTQPYYVRQSRTGEFLVAFAALPESQCEEVVDRFVELLTLSDISRT